MEDQANEHQLVAPPLCRFCAKEAISPIFLDLQTNPIFYEKAIKRLEYMNVKPAKKPHMNICKSCYDSFNSAYNFCLTFNHAQVKLANIYVNEKVSSLINISAGTKRVLANIKVEVDSADEIDTEKEGELFPSNKRKKQIIGIDKSWKSYAWTCCYCDEHYSSLAALSLHGKKIHGYCFAFECPDCDIKLNKYPHFIEHVRIHKENLRLYCDVCDKPIGDPNLHNHAAGRSRCNHCGKIFRDFQRLSIHKNVYQKRVIDNTMKNKRYIITVPDLQDDSAYPDCSVFQSWKDYVWVCKLCDIKFHSARFLRRHGDAAHNTCVVLKCLDCNATAKRFQTLVVHIMHHRPSLRHFCPYCDNLAHSDKLFREHIQGHLANSSFCAECGEFKIKKKSTESTTSSYWFLEPNKNNATRKELKETNDNIKLVQQAGEASNENNINNTKFDNDCEEEESEIDDASATDSDYDINDDPSHKLRNPTSCSSCNIIHRDRRLYKEHTNTSYCPICDKSFNCITFRDKHIFSTHMAEKPYECYKCGKCYCSRSEAYRCMESHIAFETEMCQICHSEVLITFLPEHVTAHKYDERPLDIACGFGYCTMSFNSWIERVNHRHAKHLAMTYRKVIDCRRYNVQKNLLGLLPAKKEVAD